MARPVLYVLAGVNGAGKSSVGGHLLREAGLDWFNPDTFARELVSEIGCGQTDANVVAWQEGMRRLDLAIRQRATYAFETTLGGRTVPARVAAAAQTHDVMMWFCGLSSPEKHMARVKARVTAGGHDIPEAKIRERYVSAVENLIALLPRLAEVSVFDNSLDVLVGESIPDPVLVAHIIEGALMWPTDIATLRSTPDWAKPVLEAALDRRPVAMGSKYSVHDRPMSDS